MGHVPELCLNAAQPSSRIQDGAASQRRVLQDFGAKKAASDMKESEKDTWCFKLLHPAPHGQEGRHLHHPLLFSLHDWGVLGFASAKSEGSGELCYYCPEVKTMPSFVSSSPKIQVTLGIGEERKCHDRLTQEFYSGMDTTCGSFTVVPVLAIRSHPSAAQHIRVL